MKTKVGIESALNSCYSGARTFYGQEDGFGMTESGTDLFLRGGDNKANQLADYTIDLNGSQSTIGNVWKNLYLSLSACNQTRKLLGTGNRASVLISPPPLPKVDITDG